MVNPFRRRNQIDRTERPLHRLQGRRPRRIVNLVLHIQPRARPPSPDEYAPTNHLPPQISYSPPPPPITPEPQSNTIYIDPAQYFTPDPVSYNTNPQDQFTPEFDPFHQETGEQDLNNIEEETLNVAFDELLEFVPEEVRTDIESFIAHLNQQEDPTLFLDGILNNVMQSRITTRHPE